MGAGPGNPWTSGWLPLYTQVQVFPDDEADAGAGAGAGAGAEGSGGRPPAPPRAPGGGGGGGGGGALGSGGGGGMRRIDVMAGPGHSFTVMCKAGEQDAASLYGHTSTP
jgi:hypothetical protein